LISLHRISCWGMYPDFYPTKRTTAVNRESSGFPCPSRDSSWFRIPVLFPPIFVCPLIIDRNSGDRVPGLPMGVDGPCGARRGADEEEGPHSAVPGADLEAAGTLPPGLKPRR